VGKITCSGRKHPGSGLIHSLALGPIALLWRADEFAHNFGPRLANVLLFRRTLSQ